MEWQFTGLPRARAKGRGPQIADRGFLIYSYAIRNHSNSLKTQGRHHV